MTATRRYSTNAFDISQPSLKRVLARVHNGEVQLPSFARSWCWSSNQVHDLLETIALGHPMGFVTLVDGDAADHRPFQAATPVQSMTKRPMHLVLDGQQRLAAAYQSCYGTGQVQSKVTTRYRHRCFFFDMQKALDAASPMRDAIFSIQVGSDGRPACRSSFELTDSLTQYGKCIVATSTLLNFESYELGFKQYWSEASRRTERERALENISGFRETVVAAFERYKMPLQIVTRPMSKADLCSAYMQLNGHG